MRIALVRLSVVAALVAVVLGARHSWPDLSSQRAHLTAAEAERAAAVHEGLPTSVFDSLRSKVGRGDTWWLEIPTGEPEGLTTRDAVYRTYALYWLLPALPAASPEEATEVFRLRGTP